MSKKNNIFMIFTYNIITGLDYWFNTAYLNDVVISKLRRAGFRTAQPNYERETRIIILNGKICDYPIIYKTRIPKGTYDARKLMTISDEAGCWITPEQQKENEIIKLLNE
jgi:hypothetical protein